MSPIKNIIFDWSGTLVDDFPPVLEAMNKIFAQYGRPPFSAEEFREKFFLPFQDFYKIHLPEASQADIDAIYHQSFQLLQNDIPLLPGAHDFLEYARHRGFALFLLSTIHARHFEVQGTRLGVTHYFKQAYTQAFDKRKTILQLLAEHQLNADETLFIGDMQHDIEAARHGGVRSCAVLTGYDSLNKLKQSEPDLIFRNLDQVRRYLDRHQTVETGPPLATVGALLFNDAGQVLMLRTYKWSDLWGIPGGKIKRGETAEQALHREVLEETGLRLREVRQVCVQDCIDSPEFYRPAHFLLLNYTARVEGLEVTLNDEADEWRWVSLEEALRLPLNQPTRFLLETVRQGGGSPAVPPPDSITLEEMEVMVNIGVPEEERAQPQRLLVTLELQVDPVTRAAKADELEATVDYHAIYQHVHQLAGARPRKLLERLAEEIAQMCLLHSGVTQVRVRLAKFILPQTRAVVLEITRRK